MSAKANNSKCLTLFFTADDSDEELGERVLKQKRKCKYLDTCMIHNDVSYNFIEINVCH